jgi:hypothetical protein
VRVSLSSSRRRVGGCILALLCTLAGCATVRPEQKEHLAEQSMSFQSGSLAASHEQHVLDNREGSTGGGATRGGGCGCN